MTRRKTDPKVTIIGVPTNSSGNIDGVAKDLRQITTMLDLDLELQIYFVATPVLLVPINILFVKFLIKETYC